MATYYVDASGGSPGGYTSFTNLVGSVTLQNGDIIEVVDNGEIDDSGANIALTVNVTIRSYSGNVNKPTIKVHNQAVFFVINKSDIDFVIQNINMYKAGPSSTQPFISFSSAGNDCEISGCQFLVVNPSGISDSCAGIFTGVQDFDVRLVIERNNFENVYNAIQSGSAPQ